MPLATQVKLLRVLEQREVTRVGAVRPRVIDVRFVAATNRNLETAIHENRFRQDLYFRLNGITLSLPPLRERVDEIPPLTEMFLEQACQAAGRLDRPRIAADAMAALLAYQWPGNIRELRNIVERAVLLCTGPEITRDHLPIEKMGAVVARPGPQSAKKDLPPRSERGPSSQRSHSRTGGSPRKTRNVAASIDALEGAPAISRKPRSVWGFRAQRSFDASRSTRSGARGRDLTAAGCVVGGEPPARPQRTARRASAASAFIPLRVACCSTSRASARAIRVTHASTGMRLGQLQPKNDDDLLGERAPRLCGAKLLDRLLGVAFSGQRIDQQRHGAKLDVERTTPRDVERHAELPRRPRWGAKSARSARPCAETCRFGEHPLAEVVGVADGARRDRLCRRGLAASQRDAGEVGVCPDHARLASILEIARPNVLQSTTCSVQIAGVQHGAPGKQRRRTSVRKRPPSRRDLRPGA